MLTFLTHGSVLGCLVMSLYGLLFRWFICMFIVGAPVMALNEWVVEVPDVAQQWIAGVGGALLLIFYFLVRAERNPY